MSEMTIVNEAATITAEFFGGSGWIAEPQQASHVKMTSDSLVKKQSGRLYYKVIFKNAGMSQAQYNTFMTLFDDTDSTYFTLTADRNIGTLGTPTIKGIIPKPPKVRLPISDSKVDDSIFRHLSFEFIQQLERN